MDAKDTEGAGQPFYVKDYRHIVVAVSAADNPAFTVQAHGAISEQAPDFEASQSADNFYDNVQMRAYEDNSPVDGNTGLVFTGDDTYQLLEINTNGLTWLNFSLSGYSAGNVTVKAVGFNDC